MAILLKGGTIVSASGRRQLDLRMEAEIIQEIGSDLAANPGDQVIDVQGQFLLPGFIDAHTHFELNNGVTDTADNFTTSSRGAIVGGTTSIIDFATPERGGTLRDCLAEWHQMAERKTSCDYSYHMSLIEWNQQIASEVPLMIEEGISSFKMYMAYDNLRTSDGAIFEAMLAIRKEHGMLGIHCENGDMVNELIKKLVGEGHVSTHYHPLSRPDSVEAEAVERYLMMADLAGLPVNIVHLSTQRSLESVKRARDRGQKVFVETCPHYLVLDDQLYDGPGFEGGKYVCSPPLRSKADQAYLWDNVISGEIDTISTDHCSFNFKGQKELGLLDFSKIPNGLPGVETRPILMYSYGVATGRITLEKMVALLSEKIARQFGMFPQKGILQVGSQADIVVWNPQGKGVISAKTQEQAVDYTPFEGMETVGSPRQVYLRGQLVAENGKVILGNQGRFIHRGTSDWTC
ncbi:dihydropyrimidinase [Vagococcus sp. BWB3-3]|uniref:Dihydropyrimidinase n=1 Tax=Vagococcus allomyrinae TaxID=2794353 RepID=A0A940P985_9ENTE|nr:dihydropyrimidinase [Vagococcus allomyrinae]MBP1041986.1 dihydropyrimidinase [Vagococcus allomyrinae]